MSRNIFGRGSDDASPEPTVGDDNDDADDDYQRLYHHHVVAETDLIAAVREVHADDAHAGLHHLLQHVHFLCCRSYTRTAVMLHNISSNTTRSIKLLLLQDSVGNHLDCKRNHSATSNSMKLIHWPLMGGLLHLVQQWENRAGPQPAQAPPHSTKCNSSPINGQSTNQVFLYNGPLLCGFNVSIKGLIPLTCDVFVHLTPVMFLFASL